MNKKNDIFKFRSFDLWIEFLSVAVLFSFALVLLAPLSGYVPAPKTDLALEWTDSSELTEDTSERGASSVVILEEHVHGQGVLVKESVVTLMSRPFKYQLSVPKTFKSDRTPPPERA